MSELETITRVAAGQYVPPSSAAVEEAVRRLLEALAASSKPRKMTYEEFLAWADEDTLAEWVNGEVVMTSPASRQHQSIANFLVSIMSVFVEQHELGAVLSAPFQMKLAQSGREPDLMFVAQERLERLKETYLDGPANLVVEVISPESIGRDRGDKFYEYEQAGIAKYWLIDPQREQAEFYQLADERYRPAFMGREGEYHALSLPGFWLQVEWLWQKPLPRVLDVLRGLGLV